MFVSVPSLSELRHVPDAALVERPAHGADLLRRELRLPEQVVHRRRDAQLKQEQCLLASIDFIADIVSIISLLTPHSSYNTTFSTAGLLPGIVLLKGQPKC